MLNIEKAGQKDLPLPWALTTAMFQLPMVINNMSYHPGLALSTWRLKQHC